MGDLFGKIWKHRWLLRTMVDGKCPPPRWGIIAATTNICNLSCPFCKTGTKELSLPRKTMSLEDFGTILRKVPDSLKEVHLYGWGEPLINPDFPEMVRMAKRRGMTTYIDTNLSLPLTPQRVRDIIESGLDDMTVSCDGVSQAVYERYRVGGKVEQVFANIRLFTEMKRSLNRENPRITWKYLIHRWSEPELPLAYEKAKELGVTFNKFGIGIPKEHYDEWKSENFHPQTWTDTQVLRAICTYLFQAVVIHSDGCVTPCCYMVSEKDVVGNLLESDFESIWNGPLMRKTRQVFGFFFRAGPGRLPHARRANTTFAGSRPSKRAGPNTGLRGNRGRRATVAARACRLRGKAHTSALSGGMAAFGSAGWRVPVWRVGEATDAKVRSENSY